MTGTDKTTGKDATARKAVSGSPGEVYVPRSEEEARALEAFEKSLAEQADVYRELSDR